MGQNIGDYMELLTLEKITVVGLLFLAILYFWNENRQLKKGIKKVISEHQKDLKESGTTMVMLLEKYNQFVNDVKDLVK
jgi:hypothetical protein